MLAVVLEAARRSAGFIRRQTHNFKVIVVRRAFQAIAMNLSGQYNAIYAWSLGANPVQIGSIQSIGTAVGALVSLPTGWLIDRSSPKRIFLVGTALLGVSALCYAIAPNWAALYVGMILFGVGMRITCTSCTVSCAHELSNEERATGRGLCRTLSSLLTLVTPMAAAWLVSMSGGISTAGIRPLYWVQVLMYGGIFMLLLLAFREVKSNNESPVGRPSFADIAVVFRKGPVVVRMMLMVALMEVSWAMAQPFVPLFAHEVRGANEFVLGGIVTARTVVPLLLSIVFGRIADRRGRKRVMLILTPIFNLGYLPLILGPSRLALLGAGVLFGFYSIVMALALAMVSELVSREQMGRWIGIVSLVRGLMSIPAPLVGGLIWDSIGPVYVFVVAVAVDLLIRVPLLMSLPETLTRDRVG